MSSDQSSESPGAGLVIALGGLVMLSALATDIAMPAQSLIAADLNSDQTAAQWVISAYLAGFALGQLLWGVFSDRFGRRPVILAGLALFTLTSLACAAASTMPALLLFRLLQGVCGGVGPVVARAVVRDLGGARKGAALMSMMTAIVGIGPLLAPLIASGLLVVFSWRSVFFLTVVYGAILLLLIFRNLPETVRVKNLGGLSPSGMARNAMRFFRHPQCQRGLLLVALPFGGYLTVIATSSVVLYDVYGISPALFGPVFAIAAIGFTLGSLVSRRFVERLGMHRMLSIGVMVLTLASGGLLASLIAESLPLIWLWAGVTVYILGIGLILPNATMTALEPVPDMSGFAASLMGMIQLAFGAAVSAVTGALYDGTPSAFIGALAVSGGLCLIVFYFYRRNQISEN